MAVMMLGKVEILKDIVLPTLMTLADSVKSLWIILDTALQLEKQVNTVVKKALLSSSD